MEAYGEDELFRKFLPEITAKGKKQHREYLFNVLNTLYPLVVKEMLFAARNLRSKASVANDKKEVIEIDKQWAEELRSVPFKSSKFGTLK